MNQLKYLRNGVAALVLATVFLPLAFSGCAILDPSADKFIVRSQQTIQSSFVTVNSFLQLEYANRAVAQALDPSITKLADQLRETYPPINRSAWTVLDTYRNNRTPENKANLATYLAMLNEAVAQAELNLAKLKTSAVPLK